MSRTITLHSDGTWTEENEDQDQKPGYLSENFRISEFDCNHCGKYGELIDEELLVVLEDLRSYFWDRPVTITSGVRCPFHNSNIDPPGAPNSMHLSEGSKAGYPCAADISVSGVSAANVYLYLIEKYPGKYGIGRYSLFTHIDTRPGGAARW